MDEPVFGRGLVLGFSIAAAFGPMGLLCLRRTVAGGFAVGFLSGLGVATADALYASVAALGLTAITTLLVGQQVWLRLVGGVFLVFLGLRTMRARPPEPAAGPDRRGLAGAYASALALTLSNPPTILSFAVIFAGLGVGAAEGVTSAVLLVLGVFVGSVAWWLVLAGTVARARQRLTVRVFRWVNLASGLLLAGFGASALLTLARLG